MNSRGFHLIELSIVAAILAIVSLSVASGVTTTASATRSLENRSREEQQAQMYLERLLVIPFGPPGAAAASAGDLTEFFDDDEVFGLLTLHSLRAFGPAEFTVSDERLPGRWRVSADRDINGDGAEDEDDPAEGRNDLLRCAVYYDGRLVDQVVRFDPKGAE